MSEDRPKPMSARTKTVDNVIFRPYRTGVGRYEWRSDDNRLCVGQRGSLSTYYAAVGPERLATRFRSLENAMSAAVKSASFADWR